MSATGQLLTLLRSTGLRVGDASGDGLTVPYAVLYTDLGQPGADPAMVGDADRDHVFTVTAVGSTREQAEWAAEKAQALVSGAVLTVPGRACGRITLYASRPTARDDDLQPPMFTAICLYHFQSTAA